MKHLYILRTLLICLLVSQSTTQTKKKISPFNRIFGKSKGKAPLEDVVHSLEGMLLVADKNSIRSFYANGKLHKVMAKIGGSSIDYDCSTGEIFWSDYIFTNQIHILKKGSESPESFLQKSDTWIPISIAIDSITNKIYVADGSSETVSLYDVVRDKSTVIINSNLTGVFNLGIDLVDGYIFIQDEYQIIRTDLDGTNLKVLYNDLKTVRRANYNNRQSSRNTSPSLVAEQLDITRIAVDPQTKRIYFADGLNKEVVSINYYGKDRKVHFKDKSSRNYLLSGSITILDGFLYWSNEESNRIFKIDLNGKSHRDFTLDSQSIMAIKAVSCSKPLKVDNPCKINNGHCQDLCVMSKSSKTNYKCLCNIGYEITDDDKSCKIAQEYLVFSMVEKLRGISITKHSGKFVDVIDPAAIKVSYQINLDINVKDKIIYYNSPNQPNDLYQLRLDDGSKSILASGLDISYRTKLVFDWASRNLYFFKDNDEGLMSLNTLNVDNPSEIKMVGAILPNHCKTDIVVHPNLGYLYFSQNIGQKSMITRTSLNGLNPFIIYETPNKRVRAMAMDFDMNRLYWIEVLYEDMEGHSFGCKIHHSDLSGGDIRTISFPESKELDIKSIAIHSDFIYAIESDASIIRLNKFENSKTIYTLVDSAIVPSVSGLKIFSLMTQIPRSDHPCTHNNQCKKFCFAVPNINGGIEGICDCPENEILASDGKSCIKFKDVLMDRNHFAAPAA